MAFSAQRELDTDVLGWRDLLTSRGEGDES